MSLNIKNGDKVVVLGTRHLKDKKTGKAKTVFGKVLKVNPEAETVVIEGYNKVSKHKKPKGRTEQGGIVELEAPVHVSNVMLVCPLCGEPTRTGNKTSVVDGKKIKSRVCKKCQGEILPTKNVK